MRMKISPATGSKLIKAVNKAPESEQVRVDVGMTPQLLSENEASEMHSSHPKH